MGKYLVLLLTIIFITGCDAGLESNIKNEHNEKNVVKYNEAFKQDVNQLEILGYYEANLVSKKINQNTKKKITPALSIVIFKYASGVFVDGRWIPLFNLKAAITYSHPNQEVIDINYPTLLANVIFISSTREISIVLGSDNGGQSTIGDNPSNQFFIANGTILSEGFMMTEIFSNIGEFEPAIFYKSKITDEAAKNFETFISSNL